MQLKTVGESLTALNSINGIINGLNNNTITYNQALCELTNVGNTYSLSALKMAVVESKLDETQIRRILTARGLKDEVLETTTAELAKTASTNALTASEAAATTMTNKFMFSMKGLGVALKAHPIFLAVTIFATIAAVIYKVKQSAEEASRKIDELTTSFREQSKSLQENKSHFQELASKYEKLSKGVDSLNRNVSLSAEQHEEYLSVVNEIAGITPSIVQGYDAQGNAVLSCKGNVEELTAAYNDLIIAANNSVLTEGKDIFDNFKKDQKELDESNFKNTEMNTDSYKALKEILNSSDIDETIKKYFSGGTITAKQIVAALRDTGLKQKDDESGYGFLLRSIKENRSIVEAIVNDFDKDMREASERMSAISQAYISNAFLSTDYSGISSSIKSAVSSITSQLGYDFYSGLENVDELYDYLGNLLDKFKGFSKTDENVINTVLSFQTEGNSKTTSVEDYLSAMQSIQEIIARFDVDTQKNFKIFLGIDDSDVDSQIEDVQEILEEDFHDKINKLSLEDLGIAAELKVKKGTLLSWDELIKRIKSAKKTISKISDDTSFTDIFSLKTESGEATDLSNLKDNINEITTAYQALSEATEEYRTTGSLSFSAIEKLMESGDEWLNYLTVEDGQLRINEQAYYDMAQAKLYELKVQALQNLSEQVKGLQNTRDAMKWVETQNYDTANSYKTLASEVMNETITELNAKKALAKTDVEKSYWQDTIDMYQQRAEQIDKMFDSVDMHGMLSGGESVLSDTLAQAQKTADLINTVKEEIEDNGKVSVSTLQDIASAYPVLEKYVQDYMAGVEGSEANLIAQLNQMYEQDVNNYKSAWLLKAQYDRSFWVDFQNGSADVVNRLRDQYGVDLKNFESYEQARRAITQKILEAQAKIVQADLYVMRKTTGDITRSAEVAGLTTDQKRNAQDMWTNWKDEYLNAKLNNQEYLITADQMAQNLEHAGGLNPSSAKDLAKTLYTNLMALGVDSGRGYIDGLKAELDGLDTSFETYSADYADKVSLAFDDPVKLDSSKSDKDTKETFDWIEIKIQRLTELLDKLKTKADNTYASWASRNTALAQAIDKTYEAINLQSQAYSRYMQEADSVGLSGYYKTLVQNGAIDISTISDENLKDQINEYQTW